MVELSATAIVAIGSGLISALAALVVAHFTAGRDVAYMKGQLTALMDIHKRVETLGQKHAVLEKAHDDLRTDVNKLGAKVRSSSQPTPIRGA